jgi:hypothetical protein
MDHRVKPGDDEIGVRLRSVSHFYLREPRKRGARWITGSSPVMTKETQGIWIPARARKRSLGRDDGVFTLRI